MEDELDDKIIYQTYVSHMKLVSRVAWGLPLNISPVAYCAHLFRMFRMYVFKPEVLLIGTVMVLILVYIHSVDVWSRDLLGRLQYTINRPRSKESKLNFFGSAEVEKASWQSKIGPISAYAVQGRRPKMEDRFVINDNINGTGVSLFAVFDGHGGEFAANYAKDKLIQNIYGKILEVKNLMDGKEAPKEIKCTEKPDEEKPTTPLTQRKKSFKKTTSTTDECIKGAGASGITDKELLDKLDSLNRPITREVKNTKLPELKPVAASTYFNKAGVIDIGKLITDEVLAADRLLVQDAKKNYDVAGTTALIAMLHGSKLVVANVGDSRGVMCDSRSQAIPLSFDHKPQQMRERKRIQQAGGFVIFNGVWRVAGILATSRALGDYPLKDKNLVIADPDILTFELKDHKPQFLILASDGLWDTFSNEEAVAFIRERLHEDDFGAKSLTLQAYYRGSLDNITVLIINFKENAFSYQKAS